MRDSIKTAQNKKLVGNVHTCETNKICSFIFQTREREKKRKRERKKERKSERVKERKSVCV